MGIKVSLPIPLSVKDFGADRWKVCLDQYYIETTLSESKEPIIKCASKQKHIKLALEYAQNKAIQEGLIKEGDIYSLQLKVFGIDKITLTKEFIAWSIFLCFAYFNTRTLNRDIKLTLLEKLFTQKGDSYGIQASILGGLSASNNSSKERKSFRLPMSSNLYIGVLEKEIRLKEDSSDHSFKQFLLQHALTLHSVDLIRSALTDINNTENIDQNTRAEFSTKDCLGIIRTQENVNLFIFSTSLALEHFIQNTSPFKICTLNSEGAIKC